MKTRTKILAAAAVMIATATAVPAVAPAQADAASWKRCSGSASVNTRGGYLTRVSSYQSWNMNCASVQYAANRLTYAIQRQRRWPTANVSFNDGYVTWHCAQYGYGGFNVHCYELTSNTAFKTRIGVLYH